jgi:potassium/sodium efflux P-type ATPase
MEGKGETNHARADTPAAFVHKLPIHEVFRALVTTPRGLSPAEAEERLLRHGRNSIRAVRRKPLYLKFLANFTHLMAILLWTGGAMAFIGRMPQLGWAIWAVIVINAVFSFCQEYRAEKAMEALRRLLPAQARVLRDGVECRIQADELVPGDVMLLGEGDLVSADGRLVEEAELRVDQSTLSGESHPPRKTADAVLQEGLSRTEFSNLVFAGTSVAAGTGKAVVFATGMGTEFGKIAHLTMGMEEDLSPLQREINRMTRIVTALAVGIGVVFFCLSVAVVHRPLNAGFIFAVGMVVAFVPEGLLPTVTLALAMGVQRMARRNALIKRLSSVETLGCCTVICTDKTGTLTQNEMTVREVWVAEHRLSVTGIGYAPDGEIFEEGRPVGAPLTGDLDRLLVAGGLCNDSRLIPPDEKTGTWMVLGDPTEAALRVAARKGGVDLEVEDARLPRLRELPFESQRKRMTTIHGDGANRVAFVKGAPREVIALCRQLRLAGGTVPLTPELKDSVLAVNDAYARKGLRVLAVAERTLSGETGEYASASIERDLTLLGLVAMMDPPRHEVAEAVEKCRRAGIRVIMITGDYGLTAESIARRIGIIRGGRPRIVTGAELDAMGDDAVREALAGEVIFARVAPEHKLRVVSALREAGHVVAVTGDGVNDAPALKRADIGVAMGIAGTDVAKEAADMVLTDDNFASIVNAIEEGRGVYANIRKFATYIFSHNVTEAWPFIFQIVFNFPLALTVMQVLAIDLGTDIVPALALGTEAPEPGVMEKPPRSHREHLVDTPLLLRALVWLGSLQTALCFAGFFFLYWSFGYRDLLHLPRPDLLPYGERLLSREGCVYVLATAVFLGGVVTTQIGNACACRTERLSVFSIGFWSNRFLLWGFLVELVLVGVLMYLPPFQSIFELGPLPLKFWLILFLFPPVMFLADEGRKAFLRRRDKIRGERIAPRPGGAS